MATMQIKGLQEYAAKLARLGAAAETVAEKAINPAADIVADQVRSNLQGVLGPYRTGDLEASMGITPIGKDRNGNPNKKVGFHGYDRKGVPNQLKARVLESGSRYRGITGRPFVRTAVQATKKAAIAKMGQVIDDEFKKIMN